MQPNWLSAVALSGFGSHLPDPVFDRLMCGAMAPLSLFKLPDGRVLSYEDVGPEDGQPVVFFHGTIACRLNFKYFEDLNLLKRLRLRFFLIDRPGIGHSTFKPQSTMLSFAHDVALFLDGMGIDRAALFSHSCGGPFALAMAVAQPQKVRRVVISAGPAPYQRVRAQSGMATGKVLYALCRNHPRMARLVLRIMWATATYAPGFMLWSASMALPEVDEQAMEDKRNQQILVSICREAMRMGTKGAQQDGALIYGGWGFEPSQVKVPVEIWHGTADVNVPIEGGEYLARHIPGAVLHRLPGEGHVSMQRHTGRMFESLLERQDAASTGRQHESGARRRAGHVG